MFKSEINTFKYSTKTKRIYYMNNVMKYLYLQYYMNALVKYNDHLIFLLVSALRLPTAITVVAVTSSQ